MATGIPKLSDQETAASLPYRLEYAGKRSAAEILAGPRSELRTVLDIPADHQNRLIYGDNGEVLRSLLDDSSVCGKVNLVYIDPPYSTGARFESRKQSHAYNDHLQGAHFLEFLRERLILLREVLAEDGSIYLHLDENMAFEAKILMDEIFGPSNFRNWITRKKCNTKNYTRKTFGKISDFLMFYSKSRDYKFELPFEPWTEETSGREYHYVEEGTGRRYMKVPVHAPGVRNGATGGEWRGKLPPPGKHWQYTPAMLDDMDAKGEIYWSPNGNPRRKVYLDESPGIPIQDIWMGFKDAHNQNIRVTGYPTEKNAGLLARIIQASSSEGDLVVDAFSGSGTTGCVAEELGRRWLAVDNSLLAIDTMVHRLSKGSERMGDFVGQRPNRDNLNLFEGGRVLRNGIQVQVAPGDDLELILPEQVDQWRDLLASEPVSG